MQFMLALSLLVTAFFSPVVVGKQDFVGTNGVQFQLNGQPFNFAGTNVYDLAYYNSSWTDGAFQQVQQVGYKVVRFWAFKEFDPRVAQYIADNNTNYFQSWSNGQPSINYGSNGLELVDYVIQQAEALDIKLIFTLTNNWLPYGGMDLYVNNTVGIGAAHDTFYTDGLTQSRYKNYVEAVVQRYRASSAVFAWELANEARCYGSGPNPESSGCNPTALTKWADMMSTFIKEMDPDHMVSFGTEGYFNRTATADGSYQYDGQTGQDYDAEIRLQNIDFGTFHLYPNDTPDDDEAWAIQFIEDHDTASVSVNKPALLEEYGLPRVGSRFDRGTVFPIWHDHVYNSTAINGDMNWASIVVQGPCPGDDLYAICQSDPDYAADITDWVPRMNAKP